MEQSNEPVKGEKKTISHQLANHQNKVRHSMHVIRLSVDRIVQVVHVLSTQD